MGSFKITSYNTHLFGSIVGTIGNWLESLNITDDKVRWKDDDRFHALKKKLKDKTVCDSDIVALQENWSSDFVHSLEHGSVSDPINYPNHYKNYHPEGSAYTSNPSGLLLLGNGRVQFDKTLATYTNFIKIVGENHFGDQDKHTGKGCYVAPALIDGVQPLLVACSHMPTNSATYPESLMQCFQLMADSIGEHLTRMGATCPVILAGDFNLSEDSKKIDFQGDPEYDRYQHWIGETGILGSSGLRDAYRSLYPDVTANPGYTVVPSTNNCWRHFHDGEPVEGSNDAKRIDYLMTMNLTVESFTIDGTPPPASGSNYLDSPNSTNNNAWIWDNDGRKRDISDHYGVTAKFTY